MHAYTCRFLLFRTFILNTKNLRYNSSILSKLSFKILVGLEEDGVVKIFKISEKDGILRTASVIDRESICGSSEKCDVKFDVIIQPTRFFQLLKITVEILDINDNAPNFEESHVTRYISENTEVGSLLPLPLASDQDTSQYSIHRYEIYPTGSPFQIASSEEPTLVLTCQLDREVNERYRFIVTAWDSGQPPMTAEVELIIYITDVNDNAPVFTQQIYETWCSEDVAIGTSVLSVRAEDADSGINGRVIYSLSAHSQREHSHLFRLDENFGVVEVKSRLDYDTDVKSYSLVLIAKDCGPDQFTGYATAIINLIDVNDNKPEIIINTLSSKEEDKEEDRATVMENCEAGTFVAHVSVTDADSAENGIVECKVSGSDISLLYKTSDLITNYFEANKVQGVTLPQSKMPDFSVERLNGDDLFYLLQIYRSEYKLVTRRPFDRETTANYFVTITCEDYGKPKAISSSHICVIVGDENDNWPQFTQREYKANLPEDLGVGESILQVSAFDDDDGENANLIFLVKHVVAVLQDQKVVDENELRNIIGIDDKTGILRLLTPLEPDKFLKLSLEVIAKDRGHPSLSSTTSVHLTIKHPITIQQMHIKEFVFSILENQPAGTIVGTVQTPIDGYQVRYSLAISSPNYNVTSTTFFNISPLDGIIRTNSPLDRELISSYNLTVKMEIKANSGQYVYKSDQKIIDLNDNLIAFDNIDLSKSDIKTSLQNLSSTVILIIINVIDMNDNKPVFIYPSSKSSATTYVNKRAIQGFVVTKLKAFDKDAPENSKIRFVTVTSTELFEIGAHNGNVRVKTRLDAYLGQSVSLNVSATDETEPMFCDWAVLELIIVDWSAELESTNSASSGIQNVEEILSSDGLLLILLFILGAVIVIIVIAIAIVCFVHQRRTIYDERDYKWQTRNAPVTNNYRETNIFKKNDQLSHSNETGWLVSNKLMNTNTDTIFRVNAEWNRLPRNKAFNIDNSIISPFQI